MGGLKTIAKYAYSPNKKGYCGKKDAHIVLMKYIKRESRGIDVLEQINSFQGLPIYLKYIAGLASRDDPYNKDIVEAYFLGNSLLVKPDNHTLSRMMGEFQGKGLPQKFVEERINKLPKKSLYLHHSFDIYMSGMNIQDQKQLDHMKDCLVLPAKVKKIKGDKLEVMVSVPTTKSIWSSYSEAKEIDYIPEFIPHIRENNIVSVHWNQAIDKLTEKQIRNIEKYTMHNIRILMK